jgi:hypothetical protein
VSNQAGQQDLLLAVAAVLLLLMLHLLLPLLLKLLAHLLQPWHRGSGESRDVICQVTDRPAPVFRCDLEKNTNFTMKT